MENEASRIRYHMLPSFLIGALSLCLLTLFVVFSRKFFTLLFS